MSILSHIPQRLIEQRNTPKKRGIKLISFYLSYYSPLEYDEVIIVGPSEFIRLKDHAEVVLTDSLQILEHMGKMDSQF